MGIGDGMLNSICNRAKIVLFSLLQKIVQSHCALLQDLFAVEEGAPSALLTTKGAPPSDLRTTIR